MFCDSFTIPSVQHGNVIWDSLSFLTVLFNPKFNCIAKLAWVPTHHLHHRQYELGHAMVAQLFWSGLGCKCHFQRIVG